MMTAKVIQSNSKVSDSSPNEVTGAGHAVTTHLVRKGTGVDDLGDMFLSHIESCPTCRSMV